MKTKAIVFLLTMLVAAQVLGAQFCIDIPASHATDAATALCLREGWSATLPNGQPNSETCNEAAKRAIKRWVRDMTADYRGRLAAAEAERTAVAAVDAGMVYDPTPTPLGGVWTPTPTP